MPCNARTRDLLGRATDVVVIGIIIIGIIGFAIEIVMRTLKAWLIPWKGKG